jgi:hypothetical protein
MPSSGGSILKGLTSAGLPTASGLTIGLGKTSVIVDSGAKFAGEMVISATSGASSSDFSSFLDSALKDTATSADITPRNPNALVNRTNNLAFINREDLTAHHRKTSNESEHRQTSNKNVSKSDPSNPQLDPDSFLTETLVGKTPIHDWK